MFAQLLFIAAMSVFLYISPERSGAPLGMYLKGPIAQTIRTFDYMTEAMGNKVRPPLTNGQESTEDVTEVHK